MRFESIYHPARHRILAIQQNIPHASRTSLLELKTSNACPNLSAPNGRQRYAVHTTLNMLSGASLVPIIDAQPASVAPRYSCSQSGWALSWAAAILPAQESLQAILSLSLGSRVHITGRVCGDVCWNRQVYEADEAPVPPIRREPVGDTPDFSSVCRLYRYVRSVGTSVSGAPITPNILGVPSRNYNCRRTIASTTISGPASITLYVLWKKILFSAIHYFVFAIAQMTLEIRWRCCAAPISAARLPSITCDCNGTQLTVTRSSHHNPDSPSRGIQRRGTGHTIEDKQKGRRRSSWIPKTASVVLDDIAQPILPIHSPVSTSVEFRSRALEPMHRGPDPPLSSGAPQHRTTMRAPYLGTFPAVFSQNEGQDLATRGKLLCSPPQKRLTEPPFVPFAALPAASNT